MVDKQKWRERVRDGLRGFVERGLFSPADVWKAIGRPDNVPASRDDRPSKAAIYKWFDTGGISEKHLPALADYAKSDLDHLRLHGEFRPRRPDDNQDENGLAFEIYRCAVRLPPEAQEALRGVAEAMVALVDRPYRTPKARASGAGYVNP